MQAERIGVWFTQGFANLYHAMQDIRSADSEGRYALICSHSHGDFVGFERADVSLIEPSVRARGFLGFVLDVVARHNVKLIIPSRRQAWFNRHKSVLAARGVTVLTVASTRNLMRIDDKAALYQYLAGKGIANLPQFAVFRGLAEFDAAYSELRAAHAKVCVKPARGVYGSGFRILRSGGASMHDLLTESLQMGVDDLRARVAKDGSNLMMLMQYLEGDERSVDCVAEQGKLIASVIRRKSASSGAPQVIEDNPQVMAQVHALVKHLRLNGLFNIQFKDHAGTPYLLEINTRLSGRAYYATVAGCNLPFLAAERFARNVPCHELNFAIEHGLRIGNINGPVVLTSPEGPSAPGVRESA